MYTTRGSLPHDRLGSLCTHDSEARSLKHQHQLGSVSLFKQQRARQAHSWRRTSVTSARLTLRPQRVHERACVQQQVNTNQYSKPTIQARNKAEPAGQSKQCSAPGKGATVPSAHLSHVHDVVFAKWPASHVVHSEAPGLLTSPASHLCDAAKHYKRVMSCTKRASGTKTYARQLVAPLTSP